MGWVKSLHMRLIQGDVEIHVVEVDGFWELRLVTPDTADIQRTIVLTNNERLMLAEALGARY